METQDDGVSEFRDLFLKVAENNPRVATRVAVELFKIATEAEKCDALFGLTDPDVGDFEAYLKDNHL